MREPAVNPLTGLPLTRRNMLKMSGIGGLAAALGIPILSSCATHGGGESGGGAAAGSVADGVTGEFDWKKASGKTIRLLRTPHPYVSAFDDLELYKEFTELTGIK